MGKRRAKIEIDDIPPMFDVECLTEVVIFDKKQEVNILSVVEGNVNLG